MVTELDVWREVPLWVFRSAVGGVRRRRGRCLHLSLFQTSGQVLGFVLLAGEDTSQGGATSRDGVTVDAVKDSHSYQPRRVAIGAVMGVRKCRGRCPEVSWAEGAPADIAARGRANKNGKVGR